jgi:hypothetical protein
MITSLRVTWNYSKIHSLGVLGCAYMKSSKFPEPQSPRTMKLRSPKALKPETEKVRFNLYHWLGNDTWQRMHQSRDLALPKDWGYGQSGTPEAQSSIVNNNHWMLGSCGLLIHPTSQVFQCNTLGVLLWCALETTESRSPEVPIDHTY